jgi:membrane dipeptidase
MQLTYNVRNHVGDGCTEPEQAGLSRFGVDVVRELDRLQMVLDLSHCGIGTTRQAIEVSERPAAFTHVGCRAITDHPRCKSDEQLRLIAETDGYVGICAVPFFLRDEGRATIDDLVDHLVHAVEILGPHRVGIGTDWGIWTADWPHALRDQALAGLQRMGHRTEDGVEVGLSLGAFERWSDWPQITRRLVARGFSDDEIRGFLGQNWLSYFERATGAA